MFTLLYGASKGFVKAFKAFIKPFSTPERSVKIKVYVNYGKGYIKFQLNCFPKLSWNISLKKKFLAFKS